MTDKEYKLRYEAQRYLSEIALLRREALRKEMQVEKIRNDATGLRAIVYDKDRIQSSPVNTFEEQMIRLAEITEAYARTLADMHEQIQKREEQIRAMPKISHREILSMRYLYPRRKSFERIALDTHRSYDWVRHLHTEALLEFGKLYLDT